MSTFSPVRRKQYVKRILIVALVIAGLLLIRYLTGPSFGAIIEGLHPPKLPQPAVAEKQVYLHEQNWEPEMRSRYHHISQGTHTLPLPLPWLLALEQPSRTILGVPFGKRGGFSDNDYLLRFGFIESSVNEQNPYGLPVGFAVTPMQNIPGVANKTTAVGLTCAACHTSKLHFNNTEYVIDGGPAVTDLGLLTKALGAALGQTLLSSKIPILNGRFDRFAKNVLGTDGYNDANVLTLQKDLQSLVEHLAILPAGVDIIEGFTRLDALNRIGNQVFALDPHRFENYVAIDAPVNYPHIWTASWFNWVQYDGSIMQPLVRNTGEAMGVSAFLNTTAPKSEQRFSQSIPVDNLWWIENSLSGDAPYPNKQFNGLLAPKWPEDFPPIDTELAAQGSILYEKHCEGCHLPTLTSEKIWSEKYFAPITYFVDTEVEEDGKKIRKIEKRVTPEKLLQLKNIPREQIGTDPAQAKVLVERDVNTAGFGGGNALTNTKGMGINTQVCTWEPTLPKSPYAPEDVAEETSGRLVFVPIKDGPTLNFGLALGGIVHQVNEQWFNQNYIPESDWAFYQGNRPNCLQAGKGYKARPLNGVWATAPFLHNGSVPTIKDLLSPPEERPELVLLGGLDYDPTNVGILQNQDIKLTDTRKYAKNGYFILDTKVKGNSNLGHEFSDRWIPENHWSQQPKGVIGPKFEEEDKKALIEFIKTL